MSGVNTNEVVRTNSMKAWFLAARPKTLTGAAIPVMIGAALAVGDNGFCNVQLVPVLLCFAFAFIMQIDANFVNDYFDFLRGNDGAERLGPLRACAQGWISLNAMRIGIAVTTAVACAVGLPLIVYGGVEMIIVGVACVLFCFLYTTTLSYHGMGDLLVLVFFGLLPVTLTYYLSMPQDSKHITTEVVLAGLSCGLVIDTLLTINNYRDIYNDEMAGKRTLVVKIGSSAARALYLCLGVMACLLGAFHMAYGHIWAFALPLFYLPFHFCTHGEMVRIRKGRALNLILGKTSRNMFIYGLLTATGLLL